MQFDVVVANILANPLMVLAPILAAATYVKVGILCFPVYSRNRHMDVMDAVPAMDQYADCQGTGRDGFC